MTYSCPECGCRALMYDSKPTTGRRRRFYCTSTLCGHRWTEWEGERPGVKSPKLSAHERAILAVRIRGAPDVRQDVLDIADELDGVRMQYWF